MRKFEKFFMKNWRNCKNDTDPGLFAKLQRCHWRCVTLLLVQEETRLRSCPNSSRWGRLAHLASGWESRVELHLLHVLVNNFNTLGTTCKPGPFWGTGPTTKVSQNWRCTWMQVNNKVSSCQSSCQFACIISFRLALVYLESWRFGPHSVFDSGKKTAGFMIITVIYFIWWADSPLETNNKRLIFLKCGFR